MSTKCNYLASVCLLVFTMITCTGCMDIIELRSEAFLIGIGIDTTNSEQEIQVSVVEVLLSAAQGNSSDGVAGGGKGAAGSKTNNGQYRIISSRGLSIADCLRDIRMKLQKKLILSKVSYVVFSEAAARKGIKKEFDFFVRVSDFDQTAHLFISQGKAEDLLKKDQGRLLDFTTKGYSFLPVYIASEFWKVGVKMQNKGLESATINRIDINNDILSFEGESYMLEDKLAYNVEKKYSKFVNILLNVANTGVLINVLDPAETTLEISHVDRKTSYLRDCIKLDYKIRAWVIESGEHRQKQDRSAIEQAAAQRIKERVGSLLKDTSELGIDMLGIGEKFRQRDWNTADWQQQIKKLKTEINVKVEILSGSGKSDFEK